MKHQQQQNFVAITYILRSLWRYNFFFFIHSLKIHFFPKALRLWLFACYSFFLVFRAIAMVILTFCLKMFVITISSSNAYSFALFNLWIGDGTIQLFEIEYRIGRNIIKDMRRKKRKKNLAQVKIAKRDWVVLPHHCLFWSKINAVSNWNCVFMKLKFSLKICWLHYFSTYTFSVDFAFLLNIYSSFIEKMILVYVMIITLIPFQFIVSVLLLLFFSITNCSKNFHIA